MFRPEPPPFPRAAVAPQPPSYDDAAAQGAQTPQSRLADFVAPLGARDELNPPLNLDQQGLVNATLHSLKLELLDARGGYKRAEWASPAVYYIARLEEAFKAAAQLDRPFLTYAIRQEVEQIARACAGEHNADKMAREAPACRDLLRMLCDCLGMRAPFYRLHFLRHAEPLGAVPQLPSYEDAAAASVRTPHSRLADWVGRRDADDRSPPLHPDVQGPMLAALHTLKVQVLDASALCRHELDRADWSETAIHGVVKLEEALKAAAADRPVVTHLVRARIAEIETACREGRNAEIDASFAQLEQYAELPGEAAERLHFAMNRDGSMRAVFPSLLASSLLEAFDDVAASMGRVMRPEFRVDADEQKQDDLVGPGANQLD